MKKAGTIFALSIALIAASLGTSADTKQPTNDPWYCVDRGGTRYCYRKGETCQLVTTKEGKKYWLCDGPAAIKGARPIGGPTGGVLVR